MNHLIRPATKMDIDVLVDIIREAFADVAYRFGLTEQNSPTHPSHCRPEWILREMNRGVVFYVMEHEGEPVGCIGLEKISDDVCYLERLAVLPQEQRKGCGQGLVQHALTAAKNLKVRRVQIGIIAEHVELHAWYEKLGFADIESKSFPQLVFRVTFMDYNF